MSWLKDLCRDKNKIISELQAEIAVLKYKNDVLVKRVGLIGQQCDQNNKFFEKKLNGLEDKFMAVARQYGGEYITKSLINDWKKEIFGRKTDG